MAAGGLGQTDIVGSSAGREPFGVELTSDRLDRPGTERAQLTYAHSATKTRTRCRRGSAACTCGRPAIAGSRKGRPGQGRRRRYRAPIATREAWPCGAGPFALSHCRSFDSSTWRQGEHLSRPHVDTSVLDHPRELPCHAPSKGLIAATEFVPAPVGRSVEAVNDRLDDLIQPESPGWMRAWPCREVPSDAAPDRLVRGNSVGAAQLLVILRTTELPGFQGVQGFVAPSFLRTVCGLTDIIFCPAITRGQSPRSDAAQWRRRALSRALSITGGCDSHIPISPGRGQRRSVRTRIRAPQRAYLSLSHRRRVFSRVGVHLGIMMRAAELLASAA